MLNAQPQLYSSCYTEEYSVSEWKLLFQWTLLCLIIFQIYTYVHHWMNSITVGCKLSKATAFSYFCAWMTAVFTQRLHTFWCTCVFRNFFVASGPMILPFLGHPLCLSFQCSVSSGFFFFFFLLSWSFFLCISALLTLAVFLHRVQFCLKMFLLHLGL